MYTLPVPITFQMTTFYLYSLACPSSDGASVAVLVFIFSRHGFMVACDTLCLSCQFTLLPLFLLGFRPAHLVHVPLDVFGCDRTAPRCYLGARRLYGCLAAPLMLFLVFCVERKDACVQAEIDGLTFVGFRHGAASRHVCLSLGSGAKTTSFFGVRVEGNTTPIFLNFQ